MRKGGPLGLNPNLAPETLMTVLERTDPKKSRAFRANGPGSLSPAQRAGLRWLPYTLGAPTGSDNRRRSVSEKFTPVA